MSEILYGPSPLGQLLYDLLFTDLAPHYLARKHRLPIGKIRELRELATESFYGKRRRRKT